MTQFGYVRVSTALQSANSSLEAQRNILLTHGLEEENIFCEVASASTMNRPILQSLLGNKLQKGDMLVVTRFDRFSRRILDSLFAIHELHKKGILFAHLDAPTMGMDWPSPAVVFQTTLYSFLAESELNARAERTRAGIENAKKMNKYKGRAIKLSPQLLKDLATFKRANLSNNHICKALDIGKTTLYQGLKKLREGDTNYTQKNV